MRALLAGVLMAVVAGCGPRQVNVETGPPASSGIMVHFTNNDNSAVNVYVVSQGTDTFLKQVPANTTEQLAVPGIATGTQVRLKAARTDGTRTYTSDPMTLDAGTTWRVP